MAENQVVALRDGFYAVVDDKLYGPWAVRGYAEAGLAVEVRRAEQRKADQAAYDDAVAAREAAKFDLLKEIDENWHYETADGMLQEWQERAHHLGIEDIAGALAGYRAAEADNRRVAAEFGHLPF